MIIIIRIAMIFSLSITSLTSQVNTEAMRDNTNIPGAHHNLRASCSYISANSEILFINGNYRLDYNSMSQWKYFFIAKYNHAFEKSKDPFSNKGFGHVRGIYQLHPKLEIESFVQKEFNYFINLEDRELIGGGIRSNPFKKLFIGIGAMYEKEIYQNIDDTKDFIKSTNYINYKAQPADRISINNVLYYQFKIENIEHFRILWDGNIQVEGTEWLSFYINFKYRYDVSNINPNGNSYFELTNGIGIHF